MWVKIDIMKYLITTMVENNPKNNHTKDLVELVQEEGKFFIREDSTRPKQRIRKMHMKKIGETKLIHIAVTRDEIPQIVPVLKKLQEEDKNYAEINSYYFEVCPSPKEISKLRYELPLSFYKINKDPFLDENAISLMKVVAVGTLFFTSLNISVPHLTHDFVREKTEADSLYNLERASIDKKFEHQLNLLNNSYKLKVNSATKTYKVQIDSLWQAYKDNKKK